MDEQNGNRCRSAFSAVLEWVALTATLRAAGPAEEDDCKSSIPGGGRRFATTAADTAGRPVGANEFAPTLR